MRTRVRARWRPNHRAAWAAILVTIGAVVGVTTTMSNAAITSPTPDQVVRDKVVRLVEDTGGQYFGMTSSQITLCFLTGRGASSRITVTDVDTGETVFTEAKSSSGGWETSWTIPDGTAPGLFRVTSVVQNRRRVSSLNTCQLETATLSDFTFEYRPWQHVFLDIFGGGTVSMNESPAEFGFRVGTKTSPVIGGASMTFYAAPSAAILGLPTDLQTCATEPNACVPEPSVECDPAAGCDPRFVVINHDGALDDLVGVFDLQTKTFAALATTGGVTRALASTGTKNDKALHRQLADLDAAARAQGLTLLDVLGTTVTLTVTDGSGTRQIDMSLLEGLQITQAAGAGVPAGVQIAAPYTLQAGLVLHAYSFSHPTGTTPPGTGYLVEDSDLVPDLPGPAEDPPSASPLLLDMGGPLRHVSGTWPAGAGSHTTGGLNVDTGPGEPNGYPVWLPVVSGTGSAPDTSIDFVGHAVVVKLGFDLLGTRTEIGVLIADGLALFGNGSGPLPFGIGDLPVLWEQQSPEVVALVEQLETQLDSALANPTVNQVLDAVLPAVLEALGAAPDLP